MKILLTFLAFTISTLAQAAGPTITLGQDNLLVLSGEVSSESVAQLIVKARQLDRQPLNAFTRSPIYLFLNTPGGDIEAGLQLAEALNHLKRPVHTITLFAASMGFQLVQQLGNRFIVKDGIMMSHRARGAFRGEFGGVSPNQTESRYSLWVRRIRELDERTVSRTKGKQTIQSYEKSYVPELWNTGTESVANGFSDQVVGVYCDNSLSGADEHKTSFMGMEITYTTDQCPINTGTLSVSTGIKTNKGIMDSGVFKMNGGSFSAECLMSGDEDKICSLNTELSEERIQSIKSQFSDILSHNRNNTIPLRW